MKKYLKYFGFFYITIVLVLIVLGWFYVRELPMYTKEKVTPLTAPVKDSLKDSTGTNTEGDLPVMRGTISPPVDIFKLSNPSAELVEKGKTLYTTNCVSCHGAEGKGDGVAGVSLNPKPRNFTSLEGWTNGPKLTQIYKTLQEGIINKGMASYSNLPPEDRISLIHFIHESFTKNHPKNTEDELRELDKTYSLMQGVKQPNQIPVKMAMAKVIDENKTQSLKITGIASIIETNNSNSAAILLKKVTNNITMAMTVLAYDTTWTTSEKMLGDLIARNIGNNGFKTSAYILTQRDLMMVHAYLRSLFINYKS